MAENAGFQGDGRCKETSGAGPGVLDPGPPEVLPPGHDDFVPTPKKRRKATTALSRVNAVAKLRSQETSLQLKELICEHGYSISKASRALGISPRHGRKLWAVWVDRIRRFKEGTLEEVKKGEMDVRVYCEHNTQALIERCMGLVEVNPAYAAGALRGMELLCKLRGVRLDDPGVDPGNKAAAEGQAALEDARRRAGEVLGLAISVESLVEAEREVEQSGPMDVLNRQLRGLGGDPLPSFPGANNRALSDEA